MTWTRKHTTKLLAVMGWAVLAVLMMVLTRAGLNLRGEGVISDVRFDLQHLSDGNDLITVEEIEDKILDTYKIDFRDVKVDQIDLENLEEILESEAFIVNAEAYIDARRRLNVDISQRTPILRVMDMKGNNYYLDSEGIKLPLSDHFTARVPIVSGHVANYNEGLDTLSNSLAVAYRIIRKSRSDDFIMAWLDGVNIHSDGEVVLLGNVGSFEVIFGSDVDSEEKFKKIKAFFKDGLKITGWRDLESINVKYDKQVVTKKKTKA